VPPKPPEDLIGLLIGLISLFTTAEVAQLVGPYVAILVASGAGAYLSISGTEDHMTLHRAASHFVLRVLVALVITVSLAKGIAAIGPAWLHPNITLVPLALGIGWVKDFNTVRAFVADKIKFFITKKVEEPGNGK
jgi:hypothetical protein